jgi:effector-binding domain-containing protein
MSCNDCNDCQDQGIKTYYRWKNANIEFSGCPHHIMEIFEALLHYQEKHGKKVIKNA